MPLRFFPPTQSTLPEGVSKQECHRLSKIPATARNQLTKEFCLSPTLHIGLSAKIGPFFKIPRTKSGRGARRPEPRQQFYELLSFLASQLTCDGNTGQSVMSFYPHSELIVHFYLDVIGDWTFYCHCLLNNQLGHRLQWWESQIDLRGTSSLPVSLSACREGDDDGNLVYPVLLKSSGMERVKGLEEEEEEGRTVRAGRQDEEKLQMRPANA